MGILFDLGECDTATHYCPGLVYSWLYIRDCVFLIISMGNDLGFYTGKRVEAGIAYNSQQKNQSFLPHLKLGLLSLASLKTNSKRQNKCVGQRGGEAFRQAILFAVI